MRARNERENKGKKGANYWSTWRKTKDCAGADGAVGGRGNDRKADSCGETERTKITTERGRKGGRKRGEDEVRKKR